MKKIIPFNNVVDFNTDVKEITAISLEHEIKKYPDMISGVFYISGDYKITEGLLEKEKFNFELPFDIALTNNYDLDSLLVDIDDFRYDLISDKSLKVNIDLYIDGEEIETPLPRNTYNEELPIESYEESRNLTNITSTTSEKEEEKIPEEANYEETSKTKEELNNEEENEELLTELICEEDDDFVEPERIDLLKDMLTNDKENNMNENTNLNINNDKINNTILTPNQEEEKYVTYRVYKVLETDTIDSILNKYNITKEMLADYNNIENINPGDKLIIPTNNNDEK